MQNNSNIEKRTNYPPDKPKREFIKPQVPIIPKQEPKTPEKKSSKHPWIKEEELWSPSNHDIEIYYEIKDKLHSKLVHHSKCNEEICYCK